MGTLSLFGLSGMAVGPILLSVLREWSGSFRPTLLLLCVLTAAGSASMAVVPYNVKRPKGLAEEAARQEAGEREKLLGDG